MDLRRSRARWELVAALAVMAVGTALHFVYEWSGDNRIVGAASAVNESVWEHMKMVFSPMFFLTMGQVFFLGRRFSNFLAARAMSTLLGIALVPILFYTYTGIWGRHLLWADIAIFVAAVAAAFLLDDWLLRTGRLGSGWMQLAGLLVLWALAFLFVFWTYRTPHLPLFQDSASMQYGI